jgi:hypothetical protein
MRTLGSWEKWVLRNNYMVTVVGEISGPIIDEYTLSNAAKLLTKRHPLLGMDILSQNEETLFFKPISSPIIPTTIIALHHQNEWQELLEREINKPVLCEKGIPLCRILLAIYHNQQRIIISYSHAIGDGTSAMIIMKDFLTYSSMIYNNQTPDIESLPLLPSVRDLIYPNGLNRQERAQIDEYIKLEVYMRKNRTFLVPHDVIARDVQSSNGIVVMNGNNLSELKAKCKQQKVTVGSAILTACSFVLAKYAYQKGINEPVADIEVDVNIRKRLLSGSLGDDHCGLLIGIAPVRTRIKPDDEWWVLCKEAHKSLVSLVKNRTYELYGPAVDEADDILEQDEEFCKWYEQHGNRFADINLSNMGVFPFDTHFGPYSLERITTAGGNNSEGTNYLILINTVNENISYCLVYDKALIKRSTAEKFLNDVIELLKRCTSDNNITVKNFVE